MLQFFMLWKSRRIIQDSETKETIMRYLTCGKIRVALDWQAQSQDNEYCLFVCLKSKLKCTVLNDINTIQSFLDKDRNL